jgi:hypothetical protein
LVKWDILWVPKHQGGLGITNLHIKNICLLSKWIYHVLKEEGLWQQLLKNKYFNRKSLTQTQGRPGGSYFWPGLIKVKDDFLKWGHFLVQDGSKTRFWKDIWLDSMPLTEQLWILYNVARWKEVIVREVFHTGSLNLTFCQTLTKDKLTALNKMIIQIAKV